MADKEFTQICKEILGLSKRLEGIEPAELRKIKSDIEKINEAIAADKASFETKKKDFDGKYSGITEIINTFDTLKSQIEQVLKSGAINDTVETSVSAFSSKKTMELLDKKLDATAKAADSDKLDGLDSSSFAKLDSTQIQYFTGDIGAGRSSGSPNEGGELRLKAAPISGFIDSAIDVYSPQRGVQNIRILQPDVNGAPKILTMPAVDGTVWSSGNMGTGSGLDADKLDGLDSSSFARLGQAVPNAVLPKGDYRNVGFWRKIDAGWYWYTHDSIQGSNNPSAYGFVHVIKMGGEYDIYWHSKGATTIFKLGFNGSAPDNTNAGWSIATSELTIGAYPNTAVLRDANGGISAAHLSSSILTGNSATLDLSKADNFEITLTSKGVLTLTNGARGQSGVISIANAATNITGYAPNIKWRTTPISLQATETFAYFVWHDGYISMGRA